MRKYIVLIILFVLPISAYIFFSLSTTYFKLLPVLTDEVAEIDAFVDLDGNVARLEDHITILGFYGKDLEANRAQAYNLVHKIYKRNKDFDDFQVVILLPFGTEDQAQSIENEIQRITSTENWYFVFGKDDEIMRVFNSLQTPYKLDENLSIPEVFIIDKERNLRGRDDDKEKGIMYGFDSAEISEINNKMSDDVKVILAEYRRALKKYSAKRQI